MGREEGEGKGGGRRERKEGEGKGGGRRERKEGEGKGKRERGREEVEGKGGRRGKGRREKGKERGRGEEEGDIVSVNTRNRVTINTHSQFLGLKSLLTSIQAFLASDKNPVSRGQTIFFQL